MRRNIGVFAAIVLLAAGLSVPAAQAKQHMLIGLQDDAMVTLAEGATRTWPWGGRRPLEVALAVRGQAELRAGSSRRTARAPRDEARLAVLLSPTGADVIEVRAGRGGAVVSDVVAVCRDESEAQDIAAACDRWSAA